MEELKYYEVEFGKHNDLTDVYSICIIGKRLPRLKEAEDFCKHDMKMLGYDYVKDVEEISAEEAHSFFDMDNEANFPIFE